MWCESTPWCEQQFLADRPQQKKDLRVCNTHARMVGWESYNKPAATSFAGFLENPMMAECQDRGCDSRTVSLFLAWRSVRYTWLCR